jgi:hypothetical protein
MIENSGDRIIIISAPHFVAGVCLDNDVAVRSAPILRYMIGWDFTKIESYVARKNWKWEVGYIAA